MPRKSTYKPEFAEQAHKFCLLGATNDQLAQLLGVSARTIDAWLATKPDFAERVKAGRAVADATVSESLYRRALGYSHKAVKIMSYEGQSFEHEYTEHYPPDTVACIFWLKNRRPDLWRDKIEHQHGADDELLAALDAAGERAAAP